MLITSRTLGRSTGHGRCPVCGAQDCMCGGPSNVVAVDERIVMAASRGPMVSIPVGRGVSIKLREATARRRGYLPPRLEEETKARPAPKRPQPRGGNAGARTKVVQPELNKAGDAEDEE